MMTLNSDDIVFPFITPHINLLPSLLDSPESSPPEAVVIRATTKSSAALAAQTTNTCRSVAIQPNST